MCFVLSCNEFTVSVWSNRKINDIHSHQTSWTTKRKTRSSSKANAADGGFITIFSSSDEGDDTSIDASNNTSSNAFEVRSFHSNDFLVRNRITGIFCLYPCKKSIKNKSFVLPFMLGNARTDASGSTSRDIVHKQEEYSVRRQQKGRQSR